MSCAKPPSFAPRFSAWIALPDSEPKLIAEMFSTLVSYGCVQSPGRGSRPFTGRPIDTRKSCEASRVGVIEWLIHS